MHRFFMPPFEGRWRRSRRKGGITRYTKSKEIMHVFKNSDAGHAITKMRLSIYNGLILSVGNGLDRS